VKRIAERLERNAAAEPQTEACRSCVAHSGWKLVTNARIPQRNGRGREGDRADQQPVE
jgi:hypothetical protein